MRVVLHAHGRVRIATVRRLTTRAEMWRHHVARLRCAREAGRGVEESATRQRAAESGEGKERAVSQMNRAEIVRRFGRLADCPPPRSGLLSLEIRGKRWVIAHSGHACIAVRSTAKFREPKPAGTNKRLIAKWLTSRVRGYEVNIKALSDFCGRLPDELRGSYPMWKRNIDGVQFNGFLVRRYLSAALAPTAVLQTALPTDPMILAGKDWRIVVMPVHVEKPEGPIWRPNA